MSDYYIQSINKTFFLSGSKIYSSTGSGSNANGVELTKDWFESNMAIDFDIQSLFKIVINVEATGSYVLDNFVSGSSFYSPLSGSS